MNYHGLSELEVIESRQKYGSNELEKKKKNKFWDLFIESLGDPIIKILLIALAIKIVFLFQDFNYYETIGILIAIFLATFISSLSEYGSSKAFEKLEEEINHFAVKVKRDQKIKTIDLNEVVVSDLIYLESGDKIPADGVLVAGEISVSEALLTGESSEVKKISWKHGSILENNKLYRGTTIYNGHGKMLVLSVGKDTIYGHLASELHEKEPISPLKARLFDLAKIISRIGYIGAFLVAFAYLFSKVIIANHYDINLIKNTLINFPLMMEYLIYSLTLSVTIIVVAVPEGLPMMITLVLSSNMKRMLKNNVLVRKLVGIETAGNINILLTDKTGTITKGNLEVISVLNGNLERINKNKILNSKYYYQFAYNIESYYNDKQDVIGGNATDQALLKYLNMDVKNDIKILKHKEFNSIDKYSSITVQKEKIITYYKGANEVILPKCKYLLNSFSKEEKILNIKKIYKVLNDATSKGIRVITIAYGYNDKLEDLVFMGFIFLKDEIRDMAVEGIKLIQEAGVKVIMITGDSKETALSIAKEVGIKKDNDYVLTSSEMEKLTDSELQAKIKNVSIVARAKPSDKSRLVNLLEKMGFVVGMTGDGVNDAPALKKANVGFAMGSGTEVAKEASDIVILDNNILSISKAILYGRTIFKSIRKFIIYQLSVNMCALLLSIIGPFIGFISPITIVQMLWLNMIMDTFAAVAFSFEPPLLEYMEELPKKNNEPIMNNYMYNEIGLTAVYSASLCIFFLKHPIIKTIFRVGENSKYLLTAYFALFIFIGIFNAFNARTYRINIFANILKNKVFLLIIAFIIIVQIYLIYFGGDLFQTYGLTYKEFLEILLISLSVWPVDAIRKYILKKFNKERMV